MNKYVRNLNKIEFVITNACTGRCKHCSQGAHENTGVCINGELGAELVLSVCKNYDIKTVMTFGGEPLLYPDAVCKIQNAATEMGVSKRQVITNGYFSKDAFKIGEVAQQLAESGVNEILLSVDAFHQENIPQEPVKLFARYVIASGIYLKTQPAWLVSEMAENEYNRKTREILKEFEKMKIETGQGNVIFPSGNALVYLNEYFQTDNIPKNIYEESPYDIKTLSIDANGNLLDSNVYNKNVIDIIKDYKP